MSVMQIKRAKTANWNLGPELVDFEDFSIRDKDSVVSCHKNTITITIGGPSMNVPYKSAENKKINGIPIITSEEGGQIFPSGNVCNVRAVATQTDGSQLPELDWGISIYAGDEWEEESQSLLAKDSNFKQEGKEFSFETDSPEFFVWWDASLCDTPIDVKITLSIRDIHSWEKLLPGQLGCELDDNGNTLLKVGPHNVENEPTGWNMIPYVGQVLPKCMYGTREDRAAETFIPIKGQLYFLESETTSGQYYITIHNGLHWSDEIPST